MKKLLFGFIIVFLLFSNSAFAGIFDIEGRKGGELYFYGGGYLGDESTNSWMAGTSYSYMFTEFFGAGAQYVYTDLKPVPGSSLDNDFRSKHTQSWTADFIVNNPMIFKTGKNMVTADIFLTLGAGPMKINDYWEPTGLIGGGMRVYLNKWLTLRFDVNSYIHPIRRGGTETINSDLAMFGGLGILFPIKHYPTESHKCDCESEK